jgi:hypothetical protein
MTDVAAAARIPSCFAFVCKKAILHFFASYDGSWQSHATSLVGIQAPGGPSRTKPDTQHATLLCRLQRAPGNNNNYKKTVRKEQPNRQKGKSTTRERNYLCMRKAHS